MPVVSSSINPLLDKLPKPTRLEDLVVLAVLAVFAQSISFVPKPVRGVAERDQPRL